jgi:WD40 repeat protein
MPDLQSPTRMDGGDGAPVTHAGTAATLLTPGTTETSLETESLLTPGTVARHFSAASRASAGAVSFRPVDAETYTRGPELARGGMGRISAAYDRRLGRPVAIKELLARDPETVARFEREARITGRLQHPAIVPVYEAGTWPDGAPFYAMKLIEGDSLATLLSRCTSLDERLALLPHVIDVANALAYAHAQRIVHRDLKPANVIIGSFGETMVVDWGLAKLLAEEGEPAAGAAADLHADLTMAGRIMGTPAFMAPEQAGPGPVDERADVYALGAILYHLLAGKRPYAEITAGRAIVARVRELPPAPVASLAPDAPAELVTIVDTAMARDPAQRYPSAAELAAELVRFQTGALVASHHYSRCSLLRRWLQRHRAAALVLVAGVALLAVTGALSLHRVIDARHRAERARADAEAARAESQAAQARAEQQADELVLLQARSALDGDPTATLAWLAQARIDADSLATASALLEEAEARGVARHVLPYRDWAWGLAFSPDGRDLAVSTRDGVVEIVDVSTGRRTPVLDAGTMIHTVRFSPDGGRLVMGSVDGKVRVWQRDTGAVVALTGLGKVSVRVGFSADGRHVYASDLQPTTCAWDLAGPAPPAACLAQPALLGDDGGHLALVEHPGALALVDLQTRAELRRWPGARMSLRLHTSPDGGRLAGIDADGWLVRDDEAGAVRRVSPMAGRTALALSRDGRWLAAETESAVITLWDLAQGTSRTLHGHQGQIQQLVFADDGAFLLSVARDETARRWDLRSLDVQILRGHGDDLNAGAIAPDGSLVATAGSDGVVRVWPARAGDGAIVGGGLAPSDIAAFPGPGLVTTTGEGAVVRWDTRTGRSEQLRAGRPGDQVLAASAPLLAIVRAGQAAVELWDPRTGARRELPHAGAPLRALAASADGARVAVVDGRGGVTARALAGADARAWQIDPASCAIALSPDGRELATVGLAQVERWDAASGQRLAQRALHPPADFCTTRTAITRAQYSPDGRYLVVLRRPSDILLWDRASGAIERIDLSHGGSALAISPDGALLAVGTIDRNVRLWQLADRRERVLGAHQETIEDLAFAPDGRLLASASTDGTIRLWEPHTGAVQVLRGHTGAVRAVAFSADGRTLASTGEDGTIRVWDPRRPGVADATALRARIAASTTAVLDAARAARTPASPDGAPGRGARTADQK